MLILFYIQAPNFLVLMHSTTKFKLQDQKIPAKCQDISTKKKRKTEYALYVRHTADKTNNTLSPPMTSWPEAAAIYIKISIDCL